MNYAWTCGCCGKQFETLPLDIAFDAPVYWSLIPEEERAKRAQLDSDYCTLDESFFVRGLIELPVKGVDDKFCWGVWSSLSRKSLDRIRTVRDEELATDTPSFPSWFSNTISIYPDTLNLKTLVHPRAGGLRPLIELMPSDHPLYIEQRDGITVERVLEIVQQMNLKH